MTAPSLAAMNVEILSELEPLLTHTGRGASPCATHCTRSPNSAASTSRVTSGEGDALASASEGLDVVWLPRSLPELSNGDLPGCGERVVSFVAHLVNSNCPISEDGQMSYRRLNEGKGT
jgi:hypothetical protein